MPSSKALFALRAKKQVRGLHAECPKAFLLQPAAETYEAPSLLDELVQQQEANRVRIRPHHQAKKAIKHLKRVFLLQGKRAQPEAQLEDLSLDIIEPCKAPPAPVGLKGFDSTCTLTTAASDDASECSSALGFSDPEEAAMEELAVAMALRSLDEVLLHHHHHAPNHHARHHQGTKHKKAAAHLRRLHSHADLDLHAPIRFLI